MDTIINKVRPAISMASIVGLGAIVLNFIIMFNLN